MAIDMKNNVNKEDADEILKLMFDFDNVLGILEQKEEKIPDKINKLIEEAKSRVIEKISELIGGQK